MNATVKEFINQTNKCSDRILVLLTRNLQYMNYYIEQKTRVDIFSDEYYVLESLITKCFNRNLILGQALKQEIKRATDYLFN
jgi:hypothetical protein